MSLTKQHLLDETEAMQLGQAIQNALREKCPLKLTVTRCAKELEDTLKLFSERKELLMSKYVITDEGGEMQTIKGLEGPPQRVTDFQLNTDEETVLKEFEEAGKEKIEVTLPTIQGGAKVLLNGDIITLEEYLDINPEASGSLAFIYLKLA